MASTTERPNAKIGYHNRAGLVLGKFLRNREKMKMKALLELLNSDFQPNGNALSSIVKDLPASSLSLKLFGYDLARRLSDSLPIPENTTPRHVGLKTKLSVQADLESDWAAHWCGQLAIPLIYHRKLWELAYILQAIYENGLMRPDVRALGFGCGTEPIPSYLASRGMNVTITDLCPDDARAAGWAKTGQHAVSLDQAYKPELVDRETFDNLVSLRYVDMNEIPNDFLDYDLCWSTCALEHLGSISKGLEFIENSLKTLRPGGVSIHTTEFNISPIGPTVDNWMTVLFQRRHIEEIAGRLRALGHDVAPLDFDLGNAPMDRFVDLPPWHHDLPKELRDWIGPQYHLKLGIDGFIATCLGIVVRKAG